MVGWQCHLTCFDKGGFILKKRKLIYLSLTIPALALMILFIAAPLVNAIRISFFKWNGYSQNMRWYGLKNFVNLFKDDLFWRSTLNTFIYGFGSTLVRMWAVLQPHCF